MRKFLSQIERMLNQIGIEIVSVAQTNGGHLRLLVRRIATDIDAFVFCSSTPSDFRAPRKIVRDAKHALGMV